MSPIARRSALAFLVGLAACGEESAGPDLSVPQDLAVPLVDLAPACTQITAWPGVGSATFRPLDHDGRDVAFARALLSVPGLDGGTFADELRVEIRMQPGGASVAPRAVTLSADTGYDDCTDCVSIARDVVAGKPTKTFLARAGSLTIQRVDQMKVGRIVVSGSALHFVEWSASDAAVPNGACYDVGGFSFDMPYAQGPITSNDM